MSFNIQNFRAVLGRRGVAKPSNFAVLISPPTGVQDPIINDLPLLVDTANLPGMSFQTDDVRHKGYGLVEKRPSQMTFDDVTVSIIGDAAGGVLGFLHHWFSFIHSFDGERETSNNGAPPETFNYPSEYWGVVDIYLYDITDQIYEWFTLHKAYPISIGAVQLGWEQNDAFMQIPVTFTYRSFTSIKTNSLTSQATPINNITTSNARTLNKLEQLLQDPNLREYEQRFTKTV